MLEYPKNRHKVSHFAHKYVRLIAKLCVAQDIGQAATLLLTFVAHVEDSCYYRKPVRYWNEQLINILGMTNRRQLNQARQAAVDAGWLHYERDSKRSVGVYWVTIPPEFDDISDPILGENGPGCLIDIDDSCSADDTRTDTRTDTRSVHEVSQEAYMKRTQSVTLSNPIPDPIPDTPAFLAEVLIPDGIDKQRAITVLRLWFQYLEAKHPAKAWEPNDPQLQALALQMRRDGVEAVEARVLHAMTNSKQKVARLPEEHAGANVSRRASENPEWLDVLQVCRQYPSQGRGDMDQRRQRLPRDCYKAALKIGVTRIANASEYDAKSLSLQWANALQRIREGIDND